MAKPASAGGPPAATTTQQPQAGTSNQQQVLPSNQQVPAQLQVVVTQAAQNSPSVTGLFAASTGQQIPLQPPQPLGAQQQLQQQQQWGSTINFGDFT